MGQRDKMSVEQIPYGEIQDLRKKLALKGLTVKEGRAICRTFRDKHDLTDKETLDIANNRI